MDEMTPLEAAIKDVEEAKTFKEIAAVFSYFHGPYGNISSSTPEYVDTLERYIERIQGPDAQNVATLYDLGEVVKSVGRDAALYLVKDSSPQKAELLERAASVTPAQVKQAFIQTGENIVRNHLPDIEEKAQNIKLLKERILEYKKRAFSDEFMESRYSINKNVSSILEKEFPQVPSWIISQAVVGNVEFVRSLSPENADKIIQKIPGLRMEVLRQNKSQSEYAALSERIAALSAEIEKQEQALFDDVKNVLESTSTVSAEEAQTWAKENIYLGANVVQKLKKIKYPKEQFINDMAEVYRYVGGKLGPVEIILQKGTKRAFAIGRTTICLNSGFNKTTLFHECGHLVEGWDDTSLAASLAFIKGRAQGAPRSLKSLTGISYRSNEKAYPDSFIDPYVGKDYSGSASEVFSMGLQNISSPAHLANFIEKDIEHFKLFVGVCTRHSPELAQQMKDMTRQTKETITNRKKALNNAVKDF